jgi:hypothetical protein
MYLFAAKKSKINGNSIVHQLSCVSLTFLSYCSLHKPWESEEIF